MSTGTANERLLKLLHAPPDQLEAVDRILNGEPPPKPRVLEAPLLLGMGDAARLLGVSRGTLWRMLQAGTFEKVELYRGSYRIRSIDIEDFLFRKGPQP